MNGATMAATMAASAINTASSIAVIAAEQYHGRHQRAQQIVRNGGMSADAATRHLRPWLAVACLCGANLPEIAGTIADLQELANASRHPMNPGELRWLAAEEICPRRIWAPILTRARDLAFDHFLEHDGEGTLLAARSLQSLALHLQHDLNGPPIPPYRAAPRDTINPAALAA